MSLVKIEKKPEIISSWTTIVKSLTATIESLSSLTKINPIEIDKDGHIHFHPSRMILGEYYPFEFKGKEYLLKKSKENVIDIFQIKKK